MWEVSCWNPSAWEASCYLNTSIYLVCRSGCLRSSVTAGLTETVWSKRPGKPSSSGAPYLDTTNLSDGIQRGFSFQGLVVDCRCGR